MLKTNNDGYKYKNVYAIDNVVWTCYWVKFIDVTLWIENFNVICLYAYSLVHNFTASHQWILFNNIQPDIICGIHIVLFVAAIIYFKYCVFKLYALILYSFVLICPWRRWRFITEACTRVHVYGLFVILYKFCAFAGICEWLSHNARNG